MIFPPEGIKIGMLPDVFYPEEISGKCGPNGVTIISRSGAILYHLSDALASAGIAQNAVIGIGGDGAIGSTFVDLVPLVMGYEHTDLAVIAGEIGGCQEEILAKDIMENPEKYPKPIVAEISGRYAPEGKTMGHAGAIIAPGQSYGTFESKKNALERAGVKVVNGQRELIDVVKSRLRKKYFDVDRYYNKMEKIWNAPPEKPEWGTLITKVAPNELIVSGYRLEQIIGRRNLLETAYLLIDHEFPDERTAERLEKLALDASRIPVSQIGLIQGEEVSKTLAKYLLFDDELVKFSHEHGAVETTIYCLGRMARYIANMLGNERALDRCGGEQFFHVIYSAITGKKVDDERARMLEAMIVASVDHGATPPSTQATLIAASTRAPYEMAIANGVGAITDVHGGAGAKAAEFFNQCIEKSTKEKIDIRSAARDLMKSHIERGMRIEGIGHRIHTKDPRRDALWKIASQTGIAGERVNLSKMASDIFEQVRGMRLPINVDGVIGAIVADMELDPSIAKILFIYGRVAGLSAHYFEEIETQPKMRRINFSDAVYRGKELREIL
jgi:citrate synthase